MSPEILTYVPTSFITTAIGAAMGLFAGAGGALLAAPKIAEKILPSPRETHLSDFLPFDRLEADGMTVRLKHGGAARFVVISGFDQSFLTDGEARAIVDRRKRAFDSLAEHAVELRIFTFRDRMPLNPVQSHVNPIASRDRQALEPQFQPCLRDAERHLHLDRQPGPGFPGPGRSGHGALPEPRIPTVRAS